MKILNLGCGTGRERIALIKKGAIVDFIDISKEMLDKVSLNLKNQNLNGKIYLNNCMDFNFLKTNNYDLVFATNNFLEHIPGERNRCKIIKNVYELLNKNGLFITCVHNRYYNSKWLIYWENQKKSINKGLIYKGYKLEYGDKFIEIANSNNSLFMHIYSEEEIKNEFLENKFIIKKIIYLHDLLESKQVKKKFSEDVFFIVGEKV